MEEKVIQCMMFDQDCFRDVRMLAASRIQNEWLNQHLPTLAEVSKEDFISHKELYTFANKDIIFNVNESDRNILKKLSVNNLIFLGSMFDGLYLEKGLPVFDDGTSPMNDTDLDIVIEYGGTEIQVTDCHKNIGDVATYLYPEETENPGYFKMRLYNPSVVYERQPTYLQALKLKHKLSADLEAAKFVYVSHQTFETFTGASLSGVIDVELGVIQTDLVAALRMGKWPEVAKSFISRPRFHGWPSDDMIKAITNEGCDFVAKAYSGSTETNYQWRISFASSEKKLVRSLSDHQIRAYLFFKTIFRQYLEKSEDLSSYMMKNVLFWSLENTYPCNWGEGKIFWSIGALFNTLQICIESRKLSSYFLPNLNLISHLDTKVLKWLADRVRLIRVNLLKAIKGCKESPRFKGVCEISLTKLFNYSLKEMESVLSMAYFSMFLFIRLQVMRYHVKVDFQTFKESFRTHCNSMCDVIAPRATWYFLQSIKLQQDTPLYNIDTNSQGELIIDISEMRKRVVDFWRSSLYEAEGIFRKVIDTQEMGANVTVKIIPEFREFISWVDMECQWSGGVPITHDQSSLHFPFIQLD